MTFGEKISKLRKDNNYTQEQLADILEVSRQSVSKWESNSAYPETEKLIRLARLFDCSTDYLLKDDITDMKKSEVVVESSKGVFQITHQIILGYLLLASSVIAGAIILVLAKSRETLFFSIPIILSLLACALICLFVKQKAWYWCIWAVFMPLLVLTPYTVYLPFYSGMIGLMAVVSVIMVIVASKCFSGTIQVTAKKSFCVICGWSAILCGVLLLFLFVFRSVIHSTIALIPYLLATLLIYVSLALLLTYTVCYLKSIKRTRGQ